MATQTEPHDIEREAAPTRTILLGADTGAYDAEVSLAELGELARAAGAEVCASLLQKRSAAAGAGLGKGRLEEAALTIENLQIELAVFDGELTGRQLSELEEALDCRAIDRTMLILDIFARRARTAEGRLQVELARHKYLLPRLTGKGEELSRLGGGIGTRGPGESKLEKDRRHIRRRVAALERRLKEMGGRRERLRERRKKDGVETVALVGYTNVGKSTLLNAFTEAGVLAEDMLFATLDTTARALALPDGREVMLIDTVGLIRRLPHQLVEAFHSTLEEAAGADLILNVCDASSPDAPDQIQVARDLLAELGAAATPVIHVLNKCDRLARPPELMPPGACAVSAKTGLGLDRLLRAVAEALPATHTRLTLLLPYDQGGLTGELRAAGRVFSEEFLPEGARLDLMVDRRLLERCAPYVIPRR